MKKNIFVLLIICMTLLGSLSGCGNMDTFGMGNFTFRKIHCISTNECYEIEKWYNDDRGIEVKTNDYGALFFSEGTYVLVEDICPMCESTN